MDYVTVSPVHPSPSKPGYGPPLGPAGLAALTRVAGAPPVFALGGVTAGNARSCLAAGAAGVAVMGVVMRSDHPDRCVRELLAALAPAAPGRPWTDPPAPAKENPCPPHR
jgi:thiamine-phosphate pyrophosphorylase